MLNEIALALPALSRAERSVAEWMLAHPRQAMRATVADVASAAGTSEPTVIRFCRSLGVDGFRDFKIRLAASVDRPGSMVHRDVEPDDTPEDAVIKVLDRSVATLHELRDRVASLPFADAVEMLRGARQIVFAGLGASGQVAADGCHKFFRLGIPCRTATDEPTLLQLGAIAVPGDVFVAVSHNGLWPMLVRAMQTAAANGAAVIALTDPGSPLARAAGLVFANPVGEDTGVFTPMSSRLSHLIVLDALQVSLAISLGEVAEERLKATKKALSDA